MPRFTTPVRWLDLLLIGFYISLHCMAWTSVTSVRNLAARYVSSAAKLMKNGYRVGYKTLELEIYRKLERFDKSSSFNTKNVLKNSSCKIKHFRKIKTENFLNTKHALLFIKFCFVFGCYAREVFVIFCPPCTHPLAWANKAIVFVIFTAYVYFERRYLFYADDGIKRLQLGVNPESVHLANSSGDAFALAVDWKNNSVYFCNGSAVVYAMGIDGSNLQAIQLDTEQPGSKCSAVQVHGNNLFYALNVQSRLLDRI